VVAAKASHNRPVRDAWVVLREANKLRWGGDLRRHYVLEALASRADALDVDGWTPPIVREALGASRRGIRLRRPRIAAATMLSMAALDVVLERGKPFVVDIHDDPIAQLEALGIAPEADWLRETLERKRRNLDAFRWHVTPSEGIARLAGLDPGRTIVVGNGTDTEVIVPGPWPAEPAIGMVSGAAPARGIETLVEAARRLRTEFPKLRLKLWLAATGAASSAYLDGLKATLSADTWIAIGAVPYGAFGRELATVAVHCIPTPSAAYWDAVSPIKLFDAMASGRPLVVTPRTTMEADVLRYDAGAVTSGDTADELASAIRPILGDEVLAERLGANGRAAAVAYHDWRAISVGLATQLIERAS
jgi:glycosyltransferase involved in cell wall biosynthesis